MKPAYWQWVMLGCATPLLLACTGRQPRLGTRLGPEAALQKIKFDLAQISPAGLMGPPDGLRSFSYELCAPATERVIQQIQAIDPSLQIHHPSPGRIGCRPDQVLAIGETHQPHWRKILINLAKLPYIAKIEPFLGE